MVDQTAQKRRRRRILILGVVLLIAVVIGALMAGLFANRGGGAIGERPPTTVPSTSPVPSTGPSMSPSVAPTIFSDDCIHARVVSNLPFFEASGTTMFASEIGNENSATVCSVVDVSDRGFWWLVEGTGSCFTATATGINMNTKIAVFEGACDALACVVSHVGEGTPKSEVSWTTQLGVSYYILVAGSGGTSGDYTLSVASLNTVCNDFCAGALVVNNFPAVFTGDTTSAQTIDLSTGATSCPFELITSFSAGVWFEITGLGSCIRANTSGSKVDTSMAVYEGGCGSLVCRTVNDDAISEDMSSEVSFFGEEGSRYYLFVQGQLVRGEFQVNITTEMDATRCRDHGFICNFQSELGLYACLSFDDRALFTEFETTIAAQCIEFPFAEPTPENCRCDIFIGNVTHSALTDLCAGCAFVPQNNTNDGNWELAFDCSNIVEGPCVGRRVDGSCIVNNPNNLTENVAVPVEAPCSGALQIESIPFENSETGLLLELTGVDADAFACPQITFARWSRWYRLDGLGACVLATSTGSDFDTVMAAYGGKCGVDMRCLRENDDIEPSVDLGSQVEWFAEDGVEYHLFIQSFNLFPFGNYSLSVTQSDCGANEGCYRSELVTELPFEAFGTLLQTDLAVLGGSPALACSLVSVGTVGTWFSGRLEISSDSCLRVSTVGSLFDTFIAIYEGTCTALSCVTENDDSTPLVRTSEVVFTAKPNTDYHLFVGGARNSTGQYIARVEFLSQSSPCP